MKLAVEVYHVIHALGEEKGLALLKEVGFDAVDYSFFWQDPADSILDDNYLARAKETKRLLEKYDLVCNQCHAPLDNGTINGTVDLSNKEFRDIVRSMEYAAILGAKHIVVHGKKYSYGTDEARVNVEYYKLFEPYAKQFGIKVAVENLNTILNTPAKINAVLEQLDPEYFVALVDVGHANLRHIAPESFIRHVAPGRLQGLHIHDNYGQVDDHIVPGLGHIKWTDVMEALAVIDYPGDFTLELPGFIPKYSPDMLPEAMTFAAGVARKLMAQFEAAKQ